MTQDVSMKNTKKELLEIIQHMQKEMRAKEESKLNPEKVKTEAKAKEIITKAEEVTKSDLTSKIDGLKMAINKELTSLADKIESEAKKYTVVQEAIELKQAELKEIYGIEEQAASLAAILESNHQVKANFKTEMAAKREQLEKEIRETRQAWDEEKKSHKDAMAEENKIQDKERNREEEEYTYTLQRTRAIEQNVYQDKIAAIEREIDEKKEQTDKQNEEKTARLKEREQRISEREITMEHLEEKVENFPKELQDTVDLAVERKETELTTLFQQEKALLTKGYEGEHNVLEAKISALESLVQDQTKQIEKLTNQHEKAYQQVQDIASKAVVGAAERPQSITVKAIEGERK